MLNRIIRFSLDNRLSVLILSIIILLGGVWTIYQTEVDIFPDLNAPTVVVMTEARGLAPEEVEKVVTFPVETAVNGATGVRRVRSQSSTGFSVVWVEFDWGTDLYRARQIVNERLAAVAESLPQGVSAPTLGPQSSILGEVMIVGLTSRNDSTSMLELRTIADKIVKPRLLALGGVSSVSVLGGDAKEYQICLDPTRMKALDVSLQEVIDATENVNDNAAGGVIYDYGNEYIIKAEINTNNPAEIAAAVVRSDSRGVVTVGDVASVQVGGAQPRLGVAAVKGEPAVLITVTKQPAAGTIDLTERIDAEIADIAAQLPADVDVATDIFRQSEFISNSIDNLKEALIEGALFVVVVLFFFLMNGRTTLISVVAMPLSIVVAMLVLHFMGFTINTMSLGGIAIAIGSLVDDAIVDVENVYRHLRLNHALPRSERRPVIQVVYEASTEVRTPIFNSSLIIIASFLPLFFLSGMEGRLLIPLGVAFIVALLASTVVALTVTPVLCSYMLGDRALTSRGSNETRREPWLSRTLRAFYLRSLSASLRHKRTVIGVTALLLVAALGAFFTLGRGFLPGFNEGSFTINVSTLPGVSLDESNKIGAEAERLILSVPEVKTTARKTGRAELDEHSLGVNVSEIEAPYSLKESGRTRSEVAAELRQKLSAMPGVNVEIGQPISHRIDAMLSGTQSQIAIKLFGDDLNRLFALGNKIKQQVNSVDGVVDVNIEQQVERPELVIKPRRELMARYGLTMAQLHQAVTVALGGERVSQVYENGVPFDVKVMLQPSSRTSLSDVANLMVDSNDGKIPLSVIADVRSEAGPNTINRENVKRRLIISANVDGRDLRSTVNEIQEKVQQNVSLPEGYYLTYGGQFENEAAASRTLMLASLGALLVILMLLFSEFRNWSQPLMILLNMPLAIIGGVFILIITGSELNIPAIIGFISLMGIATRNGMLLMNRYNALAAEGKSIADRVIIGSEDRLLPIVMTALTSALALLPIALNGDMPGNEIQSPMAIVILGGLVTSTVLNAYVVPAIYTIIQTKKENKCEKSV
jgi:CzcA family heavy metal efflux pump